MPLIVIGALLASQIAWAKESTYFTAQNKALKQCESRASIRRAKRLIRAGRKANCALPGAASTASTQSKTSSSVSSASSVSSVSSFSVDTLDDTTVHTQFVLLGETGPTVAAAKIFLDDEALFVTSISVNLAAETNVIDDLLIFDENRHLLGHARMDPSNTTNRKYKLSLAAGALTVPRRQDFHFYVRPKLLTRDQGALSNEVIAVSNLLVEGNGEWTSQKYAKSSTENFPSFLTARSEITKVANALSATDSLVSGQDRKLGAFTFEGRRSDPVAHIQIQQVVFDIGRTGGIELSNVYMRADGSDDRRSCTANASQITCLVSAGFGELNEGPRTLTVYGSVFIPDNTQNASLRISINQAGDILTSGAISWWDGSNTFEWVSLPAPIADGTYWQN